MQTQGFFARVFQGFPFFFCPQKKGAFSRDPVEGALKREPLSQESPRSRPTFSCGMLALRLPAPEWISGERKWVVLFRTLGSFLQQGCSIIWET